MIRKACCKINLGLDVVRRREDGYHDLETLLLPVAGLYDTVEAVPCGGADAELLTRGIAVDCPPAENLCLKAWRLMCRLYGVDAVRITLDKRVPFGAGLGGGSSDATAVLLLLDELFGLRLSEERLIGLAAELGSDTAFFVRGTPQLCTGRGDVMTPFALDLSGYRLLIVKPEQGISTREAYRGVRPRVPEVPLADRLRRPVGAWQGVVTNDFEPSVFAACPQVEAIRDRLLSAGAVYAAMSGSGSAVFGLFDRSADLPPIPRVVHPCGAAREFRPITDVWYPRHPRHELSGGPYMRFAPVAVGRNRGECYARAHRTAGGRCQHPAGILSMRRW